MKPSNSKTKAKAFWGAAFVLLVALLFTGCTQAAKPEEPPLHGKRDKLYDEKDRRGNRQERGTPRYSGIHRCK